MDQSDQMSPAELLTVTEALGWSRTDTCRILDVSDRTMRWWMAEPGRIPEGVREEVEAAEDATADAVDGLVRSLREMRDPVVEVYRLDQDFWERHPRFKPFPSRWWRVVAYRASLEVDDVTFEWAGRANT